MKQLPILIFVLIFKYGNCQTSIATLKFFFDDCRNRPGTRVNTFISTVEFFKLPEDTISFKASLWELGMPSVIFRNVSVSEYRMEYVNLYHQKIKKIISINNGENELVICPDSLNASAYKQNTIARLKENDTIAIYYFGGHIIYSQYKILIQKKGTNVFATLYQPKNINQGNQLEETNARSCRSCG